MTVLVSGSVAVDHIMVFQGRFKDVILPDRVHALNVAFHVPELRRTFGGCAANIAYNLRLLGDDPLVLATVGAPTSTSTPPGSTAAASGATGSACCRARARAGAYITTDLDDNQIVGFHPGAMERAHEVRVDDVRAPIERGIVSPNGRRAMVEHARALKARGVPTVVDPGQGLPILAGEELVEMIEGAEIYIVNDYEWSLTLERSGLSGDEIAARARAVIVTRGAEGSLLRRGDDVVEIPAVAVERVVDPTGAGDAYRAGLLHGLGRGLPLETAARIGSLLGSLQVAHPGTQALTLDLADFRARFERAFGAPLG